MLFKATGRQIQSVCFFMLCSGMLVYGFSPSDVYAQSTLATSGDVLAVGLPLFGLGTAYSKDDKEGMKQWAKSTATSIVMTEVLKESFADTDWGTRPNGGKKSFPSGHTASSCSAAAFLSERYGKEYGIPAYSFAALVAYSRVHEHKHYWRDVIAGCSFSTATTLYLTTSYKTVTVQPVIGSEMKGIEVSAQF